MIHRYISKDDAIYAARCYNDGLPFQVLGPIEEWQADGSDPSGYDWDNEAEPYSKVFGTDRHRDRPEFWPKRA